MEMKILGIESSCDETAASVVENGSKILSNVVVSQIDIHAAYGGVIPEVAARSHIEAINPVIEKALTDAKLSIHDIDAIFVSISQQLHRLAFFMPLKPLAAEADLADLKARIAKISVPHDFLLCCHSHME